VVEAVDIPVIAAGGIATARALAAVLASGASAARIGTRFIATPEAGAHPDYLKRILAASAGDTVLTEAFEVMWPNAPHRVLRSAVAAAEALPDAPVGEIEADGQRMPVPRFAVFPPDKDATGHVEAMALYAGESVENVNDVRPAAEIVAELVTGAEKRLASSPN
jgi:NAD(P)H-dependent flavin oxidoreductase YrpB (nitropropane dioxygenase family)